MKAAQTESELALPLETLDWIIGNFDIYFSSKPSWTSGNRRKRGRLLFVGGSGGWACETSHLPNVGASAGHIWSLRRTWCTVFEKQGKVLWRLLFLQKKKVPLSFSPLLINRARLQSKHKHRPLFYFWQLFGVRMCSSWWKRRLETSSHCRRARLCPSYKCRKRAAASDNNTSREGAHTQRRQKPRGSDSGGIQDSNRVY